MIDATNFKLTTKSLILFLSPNYARRILVEIDESNENILEFLNDDFVETYSAGSLFGNEDKLISKKEQFEITDLFKGWIKNFRQDNKSKDSKIYFIASPYINNIEGGDLLLNYLENHLEIKPIIFNLTEQSRLSLLGIKHGILGYRINSRLLHLNIDQDKIHLTFGDSHKQDKTLDINFGIDLVAESIINLRKTNQLDSLISLIKSNLYKFIEQARIFGKPQLIGFDEMTARLLSNILSRDTKVQRVNASSIQNLSYKMIDSQFTYWNGLNSIHASSTDYAAARIILTGFLLEGLGGITCTFEINNFIKGFLIDKLLIEKDIFSNQFSGHYSDWQKSAFDTLLRFHPSDFSRSCQLATLANKIFFDSSQDWLHSWNRKEKNILWLSAFFYHSLSKLHTTLVFEIISNLQGINQTEAQLISSIIGLSSFTESIKQSKYLDILPVELQSIARKMSAIIQISKALDISGRSAIHNIKLEGKPNLANCIILKIFPRLQLDIMPEIIQLENLKRYFENQFDQKIEIQVVETESNNTDELLGEINANHASFISY